MQTTTNTTTKIETASGATVEIDYGKIEVEMVRRAIGNPKTKKDEIVGLALALGLVKSKSAGDRILVAALRGMIADLIAQVEERRERERAAALAARQNTESEVRMPVTLASEERKPRVRLTREQRARKLARNRRRHKRALTRRGGGWANGQRTIRESAQVAA